MSQTETKWIHFTFDWEADDELTPQEYRCKRCGEVLESTNECYEHRHGLLPDCTLNRARQHLNSLLRGQNEDV